MLLDFLNRSKSFLEAKELLANSGGHILIEGPFSSATAHFVYSFANSGQKALYIVDSELKAHYMYNDLCYFASLSDKSGITQDQILYLKPAEYMLYDVEARSNEESGNRIGTLYKLLSGDWQILVLSAESFGQWLPNPRDLRDVVLSLKCGDQIEISELAKKLVLLGYKRSYQVDGQGLFAVRGDIVDIFPFSAENPYRLEFFDNEIDTLRSFDKLTQRTIDKIEGKIQILPSAETLIWNERQLLDVKLALKGAILNEPQDSLSSRRMKEDVEKFAMMDRFAGYDRYLPYILRNTYSVLDYTGKINVFVDKLHDVETTINDLLTAHAHTCETIHDTTGLPSKAFEIVMDSTEAFHQIKVKGKNLCSFEEFISAEKESEYSYTKRIKIDVRETDASVNNIQALVGSIEEWVQKGYTAYVLLDSNGKIHQMSETLTDHDIKNTEITRENVVSAGKTSNFTKKAVVMYGGIHDGMVYPDEKVVILSENTLYKREKAKKKHKNQGDVITSFTDLHEGDYVVHEVHGIGKFVGIKSMSDGEIHRDYIIVSFRNDAKLYIPTEYLERLSKFIGNDGAEPVLSSLSSGDWKKTTLKVKENLRTYAKELVELYAKRSRIEGRACIEDNNWQQEFESAFPYEETEDQLRCVEEIKHDMESRRPMERLLCGDVGYGKTEVALRACFKAVQSGYQVAFMVPTTVLARQHYDNFVERFKNFPVRVDYLCRFRTAKERAKVLEDTAKGRIDLLVGTHALIKNSVKFQNLGLAIIDEEQRFGVMHKEKFKQDNPNVDILSLSATPIPRTLHMSLSGIRDISVLEDPPEDRVPVQTYVAEWDEAMIRNAIYREMARKGQVFYLYNRVETMPEALLKLKTLAPEARIVMAHGQMSENQLEEIMDDFAKQEYDVLLCTSIIEAGLDMPNVNTIIIEDSDRMGLSQLYQMRGRVGRSSRLAYAYITFKRDKKLSEVAEKRLKTIRDFTEFGSGFKIALKDLEIRGAGSVLGERQHGQLSKVGYETYVRLLNEVVLEEQTGLPAPEKKTATIDIKINAYISHDYIEDEETRLEFYYKISRICDNEDENELLDELIDRYGEVPVPVLNLIKISRIRHLAEDLDISLILKKPGGVSLTMNGTGMRILRASQSPKLEKYANLVTLHLKADPKYIVLRVGEKAGEREVIDAVLTFLKDISEVISAEEAQSQKEGHNV